MTGVAANGLLWPWDTVFEHEEVLPGTKTSGRRIDYAVGNGVLVPSTVQQSWWHSDHALVSYTVDVELPAGHSRPTRRLLREDKISEDQWRDAWPAASFSDAVSAGRVDEAWTLLSDVAVLADPGSPGVPRSASWRPQVVQHVRSKAAGGREPLLVVQLNRLWRRLLQLRRQPRDQRLRDRVARQAGELTVRAPWLRELPYFEAEAWCEWMREHIDQEEEIQRAAAISSRRQRLDKDPKEVATWIRRRDQLGVELARPVPGEAAVSKAAIHPVRVVREAESTWMARWGKQVGTGQVEALLAQLPQLPQHEWAACDHR